MRNNNKLAGLTFEEMEFQPEQVNRKIGALALGDQERIQRFFAKHNL